MTDDVERWLSECTDGRCHEDTVAILKSFARWVDGQENSESQEPDEITLKKSEIASLRAKVAELENQVRGGVTMYIDLSDHLATLQAKLDKAVEGLKLTEGDPAVVECLLFALVHRMNPTPDGKWCNKPVSDLLAERALAAKTLRYLWAKINNIQSLIKELRP